MTTGDTNQLFSSRWIAEFEKQIQRRRHVLLYGNIHDAVFWNGKHTGVKQYLFEYFTATKFTVIMRYDLVDGFCYSDEASPTPGSQPATAPTMRKWFDGIVQQAVMPGSAPLLQGQSGSGSRQPRIMPEDAFSRVRHALSQQQVSVAATVDYGDMVTGDQGHFAPDERVALTFLKKCTLEARVLAHREAPDKAGYLNTLVLLASDLRSVPAWFYRDHPHLALVQVGRPDWKERR